MPTPTFSTAPKSSAPGTLPLLCGGCACWCDDIRLASKTEATIVAEPACSLLNQTWLPRIEQSIATAASKTSVAAALKLSQQAPERASAVQLLLGARAPLIYGLSHATCEAQSLAVRLAELLRGYFDTPRSQNVPSRGLTLQTIGEARATWGEVCDRADLLLFVDCEPWETMPRFSERLQLERPLKNGAARKLWQIQSAQNKTAKQTIAVSAKLNCTPAQLTLRFDEWQVTAQSSSSSAAIKPLELLRADQFTARLRGRCAVGSALRRVAKHAISGAGL